MRCSCWSCLPGAVKKRVKREKQVKKDFDVEVKEIKCDLCSHCKEGKLVLISFDEEDWYQCLNCRGIYCL